eukprot:gnl/MRDRNA2_/MRDRNA2_107897_c0_seq1.p1 gnl/MRDRNA2_/MRDRNA2_107897_c0~~gnl/MRDRNA2_/MRDRNA2_107897_c0_seq1.p1  ORF type:complete len:338 (-),score=81.59 gnl/MRDRNA2_/MRDRNA2_107897_c0_seq1:203-1216(-)
MPRPPSSVRKREQKHRVAQENLFSNDEIEFYREWMRSKSTTLIGEVSLFQIEMLYKSNRQMRLKHEPSKLSFDLGDILTKVQRKPHAHGQQLALTLNDLVEKMKACWDSFEEAKQGVSCNCREAGDTPPTNLLSVLAFQREQKEAFGKSLEDALILIPAIQSRISELEDLQAELNNAGDFMSDKGWFAPQPSRGSREQMYSGAVAALHSWSEEVAAEPRIQASEEALEVSREALTAAMSEDNVTDESDARMSPDLGKAFAILVDRLEKEHKFWTNLNPFADLPVHHVRWAAILLRQEIGEELFHFHRLKHAIENAQQNMLEKASGRSTVKTPPPKTI